MVKERQRLGYLRLKFLRKDGLGYSANLFVNNLTAFENQQGRDTANTKTSGNLGVFINVQFGYNGFAFIIAGEFFDYRTNHLTRTAPFCPEIHQNRFVRFHDFVKIGIGKFYCFSHVRKY